MASLVEDQNESEETSEDVPSSMNILKMISKRLHCNQQVQCLVE